MNNTTIDQLECVSYPASETPDEILRIRHDCYLHENAIEPRDNRLFRDQFDHDASAFNCAILLSGQPLAAIRVSVLSGNKRFSPTYDAFSDVLDPYLDSGHTIIDPTRFVVCHKARIEMPKLYLLALRFPFIACGFFDAELGLGAVRRAHAAFYRRAFCASRLSEERPYPGLKCKLGLMACKYKEKKQAIIERHPILSYTNEEGEAYFQSK